MTDPFERLGLPRRFSVDPAVLEREYLARSRAVHPDFHAGATADAQAKAEAESAAINDAYITLKDPFRRAEALLALLGGPGASDQKQMPPAFLMEMLDLRERIEEADEAAKGMIEAEMTDREAETFRGIAAAFDRGELSPVGLKAIRSQLNAAKYLRGLLRDLRAAIE